MRASPRFAPPQLHRSPARMISPHRRQNPPIFINKRESVGERGEKVGRRQEVELPDLNRFLPVNASRQIWESFFCLTLRPPLLFPPSRNASPTRQGSSNPTLHRVPSRVVANLRPHAPGPRKGSRARACSNARTADSQRKGEHRVKSRANNLVLFRSRASRLPWRSQRVDNTMSTCVRFTPPLRHDLGTNLNERSVLTTARKLRGGLPVPQDEREGWTTGSHAGAKRAGLRCVRRGSKSKATYFGRVS